MSDNSTGRIDGPCPQTTLNNTTNTNKATKGTGSEFIPQRDYSNVVYQNKKNGDSFEKIPSTRGALSDLWQNLKDNFRSFLNKLFGINRSTNLQKNKQAKSGNSSNSEDISVASDSVSSLATEDDYDYGLKNFDDVAYIDNESLIDFDAFLPSQNDDLASLLQHDLQSKDVNEASKLSIEEQCKQIETIIDNWASEELQIHQEQRDIDSVKKIAEALKNNIQQNDASIGDINDCLIKANIYTLPEGLTFSKDLRLTDMPNLKFIPSLTAKQSVFINNCPLLNCDATSKVTINEHLRIIKCPALSNWSSEFICGGNISIYDAKKMTYLPKSVYSSALDGSHRDITLKKTGFSKKSAKSILKTLKDNPDVGYSFTCK